MSAAQKRRRGFLTIPEDKRRREIFQPLHELWLRYAAGLLEGLPHAGGSGGSEGKAAAASAASAAAASAEAERRMRGADLHGAEVRVVACSCPSRVGVTGIVVRDSAQTLQLITSRPSTRRRRHSEAGGGGGSGEKTSDDPDAPQDAAAAAAAAAADDALVVVPKRGALFSLELLSSSGGGGSSKKGGGGARGDGGGSPHRWVVSLRGDDLTRGV